MRKNKVAALLRTLADLVESMDDDQLIQFTASLSRLGIDGKSSKDRPTLKKVPETVPYEAILNQLTALSSRDDGNRLLDKFELNRRELEQLARLRDIHVNKGDAIQRIREKIVEAVIGARLSSQAIRGR